MAHRWAADVFCSGPRLATAATLLLIDLFYCARKRSSFQSNVAAVASRWEHCVRFTSKRAAFPGAITRRWAPQTPLHAFDLVERENERNDFASQRDKRLIIIVCLTN